MKSILKLQASSFLFLFFQILLVSFSPWSFAADEVDIGNIVISANLQPQSKNQVSQSVTVITRNDLESQKALSVSDALRRVPGVDVVSLGVPGDDLDIRIRGSDRDEVLVLIDGLAINNLLDSRANVLNLVPIDLVEKIEIVKGAQSVIYGGSAVGGVINIITKTGDTKPLYSLSADVGNLGTFKETALASAKYGQHGFGLSFSRQDQKGRFGNDRYGGNHLFSNYSFDFSDKSRLKLQMTYLNPDQDLAFGSAVSFANFPTIDYYVIKDQDRHFERNIIIPQAIFEAEPLDWYSFRLAYGMYYENQRLENSNQFDTSSDPAATVDSQLFTSTGQRHGFDLRNQLRVVNEKDFESVLTFGFNGDWEFLHFTDAAFPGDVSTKTTTVFPDESLGQESGRRNLAGYVLSNTTLAKNANISLGLRYDDNTTYGSATSPRISASYFYPKTQSKIFAGYSQGFQAPTLNQYYLALIGGTLSQRLTKEEGETYEIGWEQNLLDKIKLGLTGFFVRYDSYIDELQLINNAHIDGLESSISYKPLDWFELSSNYTFMNAVNDDDGSDLADRPRHRFNGDVIVTPVKDFAFQFNAQAVSQRKIATILSTDTLGDLPIAFFDSQGNPAGESLPAYYTLNVAARYQQHIKHKSWIVPPVLVYSARVNNLLNKSYQESFGYPLPRLTFLAGVEARY